MSGKLITCVICGREVSKRSTLSLSELGGMEGRACREHEEVAQMVEKQKSAKANARQMEEIHERMQVITAVSGVRMMKAIHGVPTSVLLARLRLSGMKPSMLREVEAEVAAQGPVSEKELDEALFSAVWLMQRRKEMGVG